MALPVVVGGLPAADAGAAHAGRRGPPSPGHTRHHAGGRRPARRPVLPRRACTTGWPTGSCARYEATTAARNRCASSVFARTPRPTAALDEFTTLWRHGGSPLLRELIDAGTIELLGGPLAHPFQPLLNPRLREFALREGLADASQRLAHTPTGIWAPECAYAPGMELDYAAAGVGHFMVDGPSLHGDTALGRPVGDSDVVAFGRDLQVSYRVWSPKSGYPGPRRLPRLPHLRPRHRPQAGPRHRPQRALGRQGALRPASAPTPRSTATSPTSSRWCAGACVAEIRADRPARARGRRVRHRTVRPLVVRGAAVAGTVLRALPEAGIRVGTLSDAVADGLHRQHRSNCRPALGVPARTGRCGRASRWPTWCS